MQCPQCHGLSVIVKDGTKKCQAKKCTYMSFHVITFENENRQFEGEKGTQNRFTMVYGNGQNKEKQSKLQKNFHNASKVVKILATAMKLSLDIVDKAEAKLIQILRLKYPEKEVLIEDDDPQKQKARNKDKITISNAKIAAYALYGACFDKKMFFKDVRIANEMDITKEEWNNMVKQLNGKLKDHMVGPHLLNQHHVLRICEKRKIRQIEKQAMIQMVRRVKQAELIGGNRPATIAACIFWQILIRSSFYNGKGDLDIKDYLRSKGERQEENQKWWTQTHFYASFDSIKKFKTEHMPPSKIHKLIPDFQGRLPEDDNRLKGL